MADNDLATKLTSQPEQTEISFTTSLEHMRCWDLLLAAISAMEQAPVASYVLFSIVLSWSPKQLEGGEATGSGNKTQMERPCSRAELSAGTAPKAAE